MSDPEIALFAGTLGGAKHYLEYGAGGSTQLAARTPTPASITSVESDPDFIEQHLGTDANIQAARQSGRLRFLIADVGPTGAWGHPIDRRKAHLWPNYALCPYLHGYQPDLILIDGRFRVACGVAAALQAPDATILIHDYSIRPRYKILERFLQIEDRVDTLVRCRRREDIDEAAARRLLSIYLYCPSDLKGRLRQYASKIKRRLISSQPQAG